MAVLQALNLSVSYARAEGDAPVLRGINFTLEPGRVIGLVGESGAGKSMMARAIAQLLPRGFRVSGGDLQFQGRSLPALGPLERRALLGREIAFIPQEPVTALNPVFTIGEEFDEHLERLGVARSERRKRAIDLLESVHLHDAADLLGRYPHQLSGGMCQRVLIAMAFASDPKLVVADEPTTALDVTIQARIMAILAEMTRAHGTAVVLITHDLRLAAHICDEIMVLYAGGVVEQGPAKQLFSDPRHPYTRALQLSNPPLVGERRELVTLPDYMPGLAALATLRGCRFASRCPLRETRCREEEPMLAALTGEEAHSGANEARSGSSAARSGSSAAPSGSSAAPSGADEPPSVSNEPPSVSNEPPSGSNEPPSVSNEPPSASNEPPSASNELPSGRRAACHFVSRTAKVGAGAPLLAAAPAAAAPILRVRALEKRFAGRHGWFSRVGREVIAARNVSFELGPNEFLGVVGESGSGKSTLARLVVGLEQPTSGSIELDGQTLSHHLPADRARRLAAIQMVFQDPQSALNPRRRVASIVTQPMEAGTKRASWPQRLAQATALLGSIGMPADTALRYPAQLSGGQRQRVNIARALCALPRILVADEIVSGLDVSVQAQLLNLLLALRRERSIAMLFISHDLSVVRYLCDRVLVMYRGEVVEHGPTEQVFCSPRHAYTQKLLAAIPPEDLSRRWAALDPALDPAMEAADDDAADDEEEQAHAA